MDDVDIRISKLRTRISRDIKELMRLENFKGEQTFFEFKGLVIKTWD